MCKRIQQSLCQIMCVCLFLIPALSEESAALDSCLFVDTMLEIRNVTGNREGQIIPFNDESWEGYTFIAKNVEMNRMGFVHVNEDLTEYEWRFVEDLWMATYIVARDFNGDGFTDIQDSESIWFQDASGNFREKVIGHSGRD